MDPGMEVTEGGRTFVVPDGDDVFYNPAMELNRDITVAILSVAADRWIEADRPTYLDAMTATGIRGVRAAHCGYASTLCDIDPAAMELAEENARRHDVEATLVTDDVRAHCYGNRYDVVDIDPFGSPIPYIDPAIVATRELLCVTATDTAPLCGAHYEAGVRRYGAVPVNTEYHAEIGLRVLISALVRTAARYDVALTPVLSHATRHYARTYCTVERGARAADAAVDRVGYLTHCGSCLARDPIEGLAPPLPSACPRCGASVERIGPIWLGSYVSPDVPSAVEASVDETMGEAAQARRLLRHLDEELDDVGHFDHHELCDRWSLPAGPIDDLLETLRSNGHRASRTHFGGTTFKTDATIDEVRPAVEACAPSA